MGEDACYAKLVAWLHPDGLACPRCQARARLHVHRRHRAPVLDYRCGYCRRAFNAFTSTLLQRTRRRPAELVLIVRGIAQGVPTAQLARELGCDRSWLLELRQRRQESAYAGRPRMPLDDPVLEADEMYQNAGKKGRPHLDPDDPPRRRANQRPGHGSRDNDRPPICGVAGRQSGEVRFTVARRTDGETLRRAVRRASWPMATVHTDEWQGYDRLPEIGRRRSAVCHAAGEWARDDDGDGVREVHCNTLEGGWTGLRNFLRPFRGVNKEYLHQYVAIHQGGCIIKCVTAAFIRTLVGVRRPTSYPT